MEYKELLTMVEDLISSNTKLDYNALLRNSNHIAIFANIFYMYDIEFYMSIVKTFDMRFDIRSTPGGLMQLTIS